MADNLETIKLLVELQELDIILAEAKIVHKDEKRFDTVCEKKESMRNQLDLNTLSRYDRLIKQGLAVVQEINGMCMGCNLTIPVGDRNRILNQKAEPVCQNCGKFVVVSQVMDEIKRDAEDIAVNN